MADSRRSPPADATADPRVLQAVFDALARALPRGGRVAVALSGGRDSMALLDATVRAAPAAEVDVCAFHVHHGLSANASAWADFCREACAGAGVPLAVREVVVAQARAFGVEAAARRARYVALADLAREHRVDAVLLAHHADDQAETTLLQLLRGAGPRGLAAMPDVRVADGVTWLRPLLGLSRGALEAYVARRALRHVDDESNDDTRHRRNALRAEVVPALRALAPAYPAPLLRAARHQAEAAALLDDLAAIDARSIREGATLDRDALVALPAPRARNLLRWFLRHHGLRAPSTARLADMLRQFGQAHADARLAIAHAGCVLGLHRSRIVLYTRAPADYRAAWTGSGAVQLPHGTLAFAGARGTGIAARHLAACAVTIRAGARGERLRPAGRQARRAVADLLREAGVPHWERLALPRVYCGDALAAVPFAGIDAAFAASADEPGFVLVWHPRPDARPML
ncbi:MAG: tRNA lysidine(34) synthetase TilS [Rudaea sp.]